MPEPLRIVDENGELVVPLATLTLDQAIARIRALEAQVAGEMSDRENAEKELRAYRAKVKALTRDRDLERQKHPKRAEVDACWAHYTARKEELTGRPNRSKLSADRFDNCKARLVETYTVKEINLASDGALSHPYVVNGKRCTEGPGERHDDFELVCRSGSRLEKLAVIGYQWRQEQA